MNSPFANLFLAIQQRIHTEMPEIAHIDQDLGQLSGKGRPPVSWPCVLIDFESFDFSNLSQNVQLASGTIVLRLGFWPHSNSSAGTPSTYIEQAIAYYDLEWQLHKFMQGWSPGSAYGNLARSSAATQRRSDGYRVREIRYTLSFDDYSTKPGQLTAPADLIITGEIHT